MLQVSHPPTRTLAALALGIALVAGCPTASQPSTPCARASDCLATFACIDGTCRPQVACASSRGCPGLVCDTARGVCAECVTRADCATTDERCVAGVCEPGGAPDDAGTDAAALVDAASRDDAASGDADVDASGPPDAGAVDAGTDATDDADLAACAPDRLTDLFAWYVSDRGVSSGPSWFGWADQGPNHYDMTGAGPFVVSDAALGRTVVDLDGNMLTGSCSFCPTWDLGHRTTVAIVFRARALSDGTIFGKGGTSAMPGLHSFFVATHATSSALDVVFSSDTTPIPASIATTDRYHLLTWHADGAVDVALDGALIAHTDDGNTRSLMTFGSLVMGPFSGRIAEIVVTDAPGSAPATSAPCLESWLMTSYGIVH